MNDKQWYLLNNKLIQHYNCFNNERFYLDNEKEFISIVTSSIEDNCPIVLCRNIARFCKKIVKNYNNPFIYVGAWIFRTKLL